MGFSSKFLWLFCLAVASSGYAEDQELSRPSFEGQLEYEISAGGDVWNYTLWKRGSQWRTELSSGGQLYEVRIGDSDTGEAFLLNEAGQSFRRLGGPMQMGMPGGPGEPPDGKKKKKEKEPESLDKLVKYLESSEVVLERETDGFELKGPGKPLRIRSSGSLGTFSGHAMPRFKAIEAKERLFVGFFALHSGVPLQLEIPKAKGKHAFRMAVVAIEEAPVDESLVSIPEDYREEGFGGMPSGPGGMKGGPGGPGGGRPPPPR